MRLIRILFSTALLTTALFATLATLATLDRVSAQAPLPGPVYPLVPAAPYQRGEESPCVVTATASSASPVLLLGETLSVTHHVQAYCRGEVYPLHVVFVLDGTDRLDRQDQRKMRDAALELADTVLVEDSEEPRIGVVEFNSQARTLCQLTSDKGRVTGCIRRSRAREGDRLDRGIAEGLRTLTRGRSRSEKRGQQNEVLVVFSVGPAEGECNEALRQANRAKNQGVLLVSVCVGSECDAQCMRQMASSPRYFYLVENIGGIRQIFRTIRCDSRNIILKTFTLTATLSSDVRLVPGSLVPPPNEPVDSRGVVVWSANYIPRDGMTFSFLVEPLTPGFRPITRGAVGTFKDNQNRVGAFDAQPAFATVLQPLPVPLP